MKTLIPMILLAAAATDTAGGGGAAVEAAPAKSTREKRNGVSRPSVGTSTGKVWEIAEGISTKEGRPATRAEVTEAAKAFDLNASTVTTQFGQFRKFFGIKKEAPVPKAPKEKKLTKTEQKAAAAAAADPAAAGVVEGAASQNPGVIDGGSSVG